MQVVSKSSEPPKLQDDDMGFCVFNRIIRSHLPSHFGRVDKTVCSNDGTWTFEVVFPFIHRIITLIYLHCVFNP